MGSITLRLTATENKPTAGLFSCAVKSEACVCSSKQAETGSGKFALDGKQIIVDHINLAREACNYNLSNMPKRYTLFLKYINLLTTPKIKGFSMATILSLDPLNLIIETFLFIIFLCLLMLFIRGDTKDKTYQKIIGGLAVFSVALISREWVVILVSLFIGGLIIASEKFLQSLAAILRTDSDVMPDTLAALQAVDITVASEEEVEEEKEKEEKDPQRVTSTRISFDHIKKVEEKVINFLIEKYNTHFTPNLKLENKYGQIIIDGVIHHSADSGKLNIDNVLGLAEVKYIHNPESNFNFELIVKRTLERIRYLLITKQILIIFCAKSITLERAKELQLRLKSIYSQKAGEGDVVFGFFNVTDDLNVEMLVLPGLKNNVL
jgi:hypothetical protein